ncbi:hypothetical protein FACS1894200_06380 [Spirochaetia bacterium]|nr:hypothetical protein FACS1894200_06380 [Spirochaetia bacterium]
MHRISIFSIGRLCLLLLLAGVFLPSQAFAQDEAETEEESKGLYYAAGAGISLLLSFLILQSMKAKMNTARPQVFAGNYVKEGSFKLCTKTDRFLYTNTTKTPIPKQNASGAPNADKRKS